MNAPQSAPYQHLVDGRSVAASTGETLPMIDPSTGAVFAHIAAGTADDIDRAVRAAQAALDGTWGRTPAAERGRILQKLGRLIEDNVEALAWIEAQDTGKTITVARNDIRVTARYFDFYGAAADKLHGSPVVTASGVVLAGAQDERLYAVDPAGVLVWTLPAGGDLDSAPIVGSDGTVYLAGDDGRVRALR